MRIGYLECFSGISGDMLLGALVDAGVPFESLARTAEALNVGARLEMRNVLRGGISGIKIDVITPEGTSEAVDDSHDDHGHEHSHEHDGHTYGSHTHSHAEPVHKHAGHGHAGQSHAPHRHLSSILKIIEAAPVSGTAKARAARAFQLLGEAEAGIHSIPVEKVHFHEVGAVDTIVDIVCAAVGAEMLGVDCWQASSLNVGNGTVKCQHGTLPVPAPATLALLDDAPVYAAGQPMERVTPTGAAILKMLDVRYDKLPAMRVKATGYGAGGKDTPGEPNLLRLLVGESDETTADLGEAEPIAVIETVIDDSNPQVLAYVSELLLEQGAWDVYRVAVQMKKGRTGVQMTVLCRPDLVPTLEEVIFRETTTIGLHWRVEKKQSLKRDWIEASTTWGKVRIKVARWPSGQIANASPEYEDCRRLATEHQVPLKQVMQEAMKAFAADRDREAAEHEESH
jgi:uncharacterized protein (TIGR00299 family) protein